MSFLMFLILTFKISFFGGKYNGPKLGAYTITESQIIN